MSNYGPASRTTPYRLLAAQAFTLGWGLAEQNGSAFGAALPVTGLEDVNVTAVQRVARGLTPPAATVWTKTGGAVTQSMVTVGGVAYPYLELTGAAPAAGVYDVTVSLEFGGQWAWVLSCVLDVLAFP
jgi:hypothetical protein